MVNSYNPDVLNCIANLSNDEVFTPPSLANQVLDLLPQELFRSPKTRFLDPFTKSGVFLREIVKRLDKGLEDQIPDRQERIDHIMHNQVYGIACTELTALLARRSVYCSKTANGRFAVSRFDNPEGNIRYEAIQHSWVGGKCRFCGASQSVYDRGTDAEQYAYQFIHTDNPSQLTGNMTFDVIIGNPPYQLSFGIEGANSSNAKSIYNLFVEQAMRLEPRYLCMITPSRWTTKTSQGIPVDWVDKMLNCNQIRIMHDFIDSKMCFPGVGIEGGVSYFLWEKAYNGKCQYHLHMNNDVSHLRIDYLNSMNSGILIRDPKAVEIVEKISIIEGEYYSNIANNFSGLVSPKHFFDDGKLLTSNWKDFCKEPNAHAHIKYYLNKSIHKAEYGWVALNQIPKNPRTKDLHKVFIPAARGGNSDSDNQVLGIPFYGEPNSICSQTYLIIGFDPDTHKLSKTECFNIISYIKTRFFRYLVSIKKKTQNGPRGVYQFVPLQDFSHPWTDEMLYKKYNLTEDEIAFIESMIRPME